MTPTQRAAIELAISDFEHISAAGGRVEFVERRIAALRAALAEPAPVQEPVVCRESSWFALVMNAAAEIEDASNCLRDPDAKRTAIRGAEYYRNAAKAMSKAQPAVEPAFLGYMNAGHLQKMQQGLLHSGYVYRDGGGIDEVAVFTAPQAQQPVPPADVPMLTEYDEEFCCSAAAATGNKRGVGSMDALAIVAAYLHAKAARQKAGRQ